MHIVGDGPEKEKLLNYASGKDVIFYNNLKDKKLNTLLNKIDIFCSPDFSDYRLTMYETISRGILNIISDDAEIDDDLINSGFVYLTKPNALHISKIFVKLLTEPIVQDIKLLNNGLQRVTWENYFKKIYNLILEKI